MLVTLHPCYTLLWLWIMTLLFVEQKHQDKLFLQQSGFHEPHVESTVGEFHAHISEGL